MMYSIKRQFRKLNWRVIGNVSGNVLLALAAIMVLPMICSWIYGETKVIYSFLSSILISLVIGFPLSRLKVKHSSYFARDGLFAVGMCWIFVSIFGALPFYLSGAIPNYIDCFFETVSGFSTTGASVVSEIEFLPKGILFWRSFTQWIGGMGILVFVLAILPKSNDRSMHILRAESPGPVIGKLVPRLRKSALILYELYMGLTVLEVILLLAGGMPLFDTLCNTFSTAGTGGFSVTNLGIGQYNNNYFEMVICIFMILFGVNFNFYFFLIIRDFKAALHMDEVKNYLRIIGVATLIITINILPMYGNILESLKLSIFQVSSIITTTAYYSGDFNTWPTLSKVVLLLLMISGACAGSTAGGIKISRFMIILKKIRQDILKNVHPQKVEVISMDGKIINPVVVDQIMSYFGCYIMILGISLLIISIDGFDLETTLSSCIACLGNIGPGFGVVGPLGNYHAFSYLSKLVLCVLMLIGRLEIYPILIFIAPLLGSHRHRKRIQ